MKRKKSYELDAKLLDVVYDAFVKCPNTGKIHPVMRGDDKILCGCWKSNPRHPREGTERTNTHLVAFCDKATVNEFIEQESKL